MNCFAGYIGVKVCGNETSESGLFINSLAGISLASIDGIADSEQLSFRGVWEDVEAEAWTRFEIDFLEQVSKCHELNPYCDYTEILCVNKVRLKNAWRYLLAVQLMETRIYTDRINRYTTIDMDNARALLDHYTTKYLEALAQAVKLIDFSACCMDCGGNPQTVTWLP
jgi:hypothetical protein